MVKAAHGSPIGMAFETCLALVKISSYASMLFIGSSLVMVVAVSTTEHSVIRWIYMAIYTGAPLSRMFAGINREIGPVMVKGGR